MNKFDSLPIDKDIGYAIPYFVYKPLAGERVDFRVSDPKLLIEAIRKNLCWVCGQHRGVRAAFVIGPMCAVNRVTAEPGCHLECAHWSVTTCPFLSNPDMKRSPRPYPQKRTLEDHAPGFALARNPGVTCIWITRNWRIFRPHAGGEGIMFQLGEPEKVEWWTRGRHATHDEVVAAIESGMPKLREMCDKEPELERSTAHAELEKQRRAVEKHLPIWEVEPETAPA